MVPAILAATVVAGALLVLLWVVQTRRTRPPTASAPRPGGERSRTLTPAAPDADAERPTSPGRVSLPTMAMGGASSTGAGDRSRTATLSEAVLLAPAERKVRKRDPTMMIEASELAAMTIEDEGTTLAPEVVPRASLTPAGTARTSSPSEPRRRVALTSEVSLDEFQAQITLASELDRVSTDVTALSLRVAGETHVGRKRSSNEDSMLLYPREHLYVVADGMGGYAAGEVASQMTVAYIEQAFETRTFEGPPVEGLPPLADELVRAIHGANLAVLHESRTNPERAGMGTTVVAVRFVLERRLAYICHIGDSRLYRLRNEELTQMTTDHTLAAQGVVGKDAHKLSRAIGVFDDVEVDLAIDDLQVGDVYVLCSDGLFKMLHELRIVEVLIALPDPEIAAKQLIREANERGGKDNITLIVMRVEPASRPQ